MFTKLNKLQKYDIYPKVIPCGCNVSITIRALDPCLLSGDYHINIVAVNEGPRSITEKNVPTEKLAAPLTGISFNYTFPTEQEYHIRVMNTATDKSEVILSVYALNNDLLQKKPLIGDFHAHTLYSDGQEGPAFVAAQYRKHGFDFMAVTDHRRYQPSEMAIEAYDGVDTSFRLYHGEEVHPPYTYVHIVNFGSDNSVNRIALKKKELADWRDKEGEPEWIAEVERRASLIDDAPEGIDPKIIAEAQMTSEIVRAGGGISIFAHPHWLQNVRNVPDQLSKYILQNKICDAFELIGGQTWYENEGQIALYNELCREGHRIPIVGSSDSHGTLTVRSGPAEEPYSLFTEERTLVFADENNRESIISAVLGGDSLCILKYLNQYPHLAGGSYRHTQYTIFLIENYFPLKERLCLEEGRLMHEYIAGDLSAKDRIAVINEDIKKLESKYFLR